MKFLKSISLFAVSTAAVLFIGCGSSDDGGAPASSSSVAVSSASVSSSISSTASSVAVSSAASSSAAGSLQKAEATYAGASIAMSQVMGMAGFAGISTNSAQANLLRDLQNTQSKAKARQTYTQECPGGGTMAITSNYDQNSGKSDLSMTYSQCDMSDGDIINGTISLVGLDYTSSNYDASMKFINFSVVGNGASSTMNIEISLQMRDTAFTMKLNGSMSFSDNQMSGNFAYTNFETVFDQNTQTYIMNGGVSFDTTPDSCGEGDFTIQTLVPLKSDGMGYFSEGTLVIEGVTYEFHSDQTVTITDSSGSVTKHQSELSSEC